MMETIIKSIKRGVATLLAALMVMAFAPAAIFSADDIKEIYTVDDLFSIRNDLTASYALMNDIDLTAATAPGGDYDFMGNGWNPIGSDGCYKRNDFSGLLLGNGHKITGMRIAVNSNNELPNGCGDVKYAGLFSGVSGEIQNLYIEDCDIAFYVDGAILAGALGAVASNATIDNVHITGRMDVCVGSWGNYNSHNTKAGGLFAEINSKSSITRSSSDVYVKANNNASKYNSGGGGTGTGWTTYGNVNAGGITGSVYSSTIEECYNKGTIEAAAEKHTKYLGGIAGYMDNSTVRNCYNSGGIIRENNEGNVGGITGNQSGTVENCHSFGIVSLNGPAICGTNGTVSGCYYYQAAGSTTSGASAISLTQYTNQNTFKEFDFDNVWIIANGIAQYPQLINNIEDSREVSEIEFIPPHKTSYMLRDSLDLSGCRIEYAFNDGSTESVDVTQDMVSGFDNTRLGNQQITVNYCFRVFYFNVDVRERDYIEIRTADDLFNIRNCLYENYILVNDIDLTEATAPGGKYDFRGNGWNPIGSGNIYDVAEPFTGVLDGNGHKIIGMRIDVSDNSRLPEGVKDVRYAGLFASVSGTVRNLTLQDVSISFNANGRLFVGGIAAVADGADISNAAIHGSIVTNGTSNIGTTQDVYTGGIVGESRNSNIQSSYNASELKGNASGSCYNSFGAKVNSYLRIGGIAGNSNGNTIIQNCYNVGSVVSNSTSSTASGITDGNGNTILNCYNIGNVTSKSSNAYEINYSAAQECYYKEGGAKGCNGATPLNAEQMQIASFFAGFDFNEVWTVLNSWYPYPQLRNNYQDGRIIKSVKLVPPDSIMNYYNEELNLSGCKLECEYLNAETDYIIVTSGMVSGYDAKKLGEQTITVTYAGVDYTFTITVVERPYKEVRTVADLYNIRYDLSSNYILMNDIDLSEATAPGGGYDFMGNGWNPIGSGDIYGDNAYSGVFDGNGHKITGMRIDVKELPSAVNVDSASIYLGLFARITGEIRNLKVDGSINSSGLNNKLFCIGGIAGVNSGIIIRISAGVECDVTAGVKNTSKDQYLGGITGYNSGIIEESYNTGNLKMEVGVSANGGYNRKIAVGGIAGGTSEMSVIKNSYNEGCVFGAGSNLLNPGCAGIQGVSATGAIVENCYNVGDITCQTGVGGTKHAIANAEATITNCYYLNGSGDTNTGATALSSEQMKTREAYVAFDFDNIWAVDQFAKYPYAQLRNNPQALQQGVEEVTLISAPTKTFCYYGQELDLTGGVIEVLYVSGVSEEMPITPDMISGFDSTVIGNQTVNVTFDDFTVTFKIRVKDYPTVLALELVSGPDQTTFVRNHEVDYTGAVVRATYDDGTVELINVTPALVSGVDNTKNGKQTATVVIGNMSVEFEIEIVPLRIIAIEITQLPAKLTYVGGETFDPSGMKVNAIYNDGTVKEITSSVYTVSGFDDTPGVHTITVSYSGNTATFDITVKAPELVSVIIVTPPAKTEYIAGQQLDLTGLVVNAAYDNNTTVAVTDYEVSGYTGAVGVNTVIVSFGGKSASFTVTVSPRRITGIALTSAPLKRQYNEGEQLDLTGMVVSATYNTGETVAVTDYDVIGYNSTPGAKTIIVMYEGYTVDFTVTVRAKALIDISIEKPAKLEYYVGDAFDPAGLKVFANYDNGQSIEVFDYTVSGFDSASAGAKIVKVTYNDFSKSFAVVIIEDAIAGITLTGNYKTTYFVGDEFDTTGLKVTAVYESGKEVEVEDYTLSGFDSETAGIKTVTVSYGGFEKTFEVTVADAPDIMKGDADGDGEITVSDALAALRIAAKLVVPTADDFAVLDIDGDGVIAVNDALSILRVAAKLADSL